MRGVGLVLQVLITGVAGGAMIGLVATGFALVYRLTGVLQLAHGQLVAAAAFVSIVVASGTQAPANSGLGRYLAATTTALALATLASVLLYRFAIAPAAARAGAFGWIGATAALAFAIEGAMRAAFPREAYVLPDPLRFAGMAPLKLPDGATLPPRALFVLGCGLLVAAISRIVLTRTTFGIAVTAVASEPVGARAVGLPVERLVSIAFGLAGALAGVAAIVGAPSGGAITLTSGALLGLKGIVAAVLGGIADPDKVFVAALGVGVLSEAITNLHLGGAMLGPAWRELLPLLLVIVVLVVRAPAAALERDE